MKRIIWSLLIVFVLSMSMVMAGTVTRSFSPATATPGGSVAVTLTVAAVGSATFYLIDEMYPTGWTITNSAGGSTTDPGHLKWAVTSGVVDTSYAYTLSVPASATLPAPFSGIYRFEGDAVSAAIGGSTQLAAAMVSCGDGTIGVGEACDDGNQITETCAYGDADGCQVCNANCLSIAGATSSCGDGIVDSSNGEQCDDGNTASGDGCSATCTTEGGAAAFCGNNVREGVELCDGTDLNGASCASVVPGSDGDLRCLPSCDFDTNDCLQPEYFVNAGTAAKQTLLQNIVTALDDQTLNHLQKITAIARALRDYLAGG